MQKETGHYIEDIVVGETIRTATFEITADSIHEFAASFDPQPMHLDEAAAALSVFGRVVASGWQTLALTMRLMVEAKPFGATPIVGVAVDDIRFRRPVEAGTTIRARAEITGARRRSGSENGFVTLDVTTEDLATGAVLLTQKWTLLLPSRTETGS